MSTHRVAVIAGDGVGPEVIAEGRKVLDAAGERFGFEIKWDDFDLGAEHYMNTGETINEEELKELSDYSSIYLGAVGDPKVAPGVLEKGLLLAIRFYFDQYVNIRPVKLLEGLSTPLAGREPAEIDFVVLRENTEDFYTGLGGRSSDNKSRFDLELTRELYSARFGLDLEFDGEEIAYQVGLITRESAQRIQRYGFRLAQSRLKKVASVDKTNVLDNMYGLWRDSWQDVSKDFPDCEYELLYVDAASMFFVTDPGRFDVIITPNMFGDILTDLGAAIAGGMGVAPSANMKPEGTSMFEPVHGSAPDIAGKGIANPVAAIWAGAMLLENLGETEAADKVVEALSSNIKAGRVRTPDIGGTSSTSNVGDDVAGIIKVI